jgi:hypothetical protein
MVPQINLSKRVVDNVIVSYLERNKGYYGCELQVYFRFNLFD